MMEIPGYKILDTLGKGGMATVYLAIQESFDRKVAIKVMSPQLAQDPSFGDRFQREAKIVSQMNHPNIVTVYDVGVVDNHHYLAMEYVEGKELRSKFKDMHMMDKIRAVKEIASALNYAGNKGYVHRDVKPENVMLSEEDGRAVLMDFGIAKTTSDNNHSMTKTGMAIGTPYYMSPEQAQGKPVDKRSDIYSLGVMFFQLLTGRVPYDAESQVAIGIKHITEPIPFLPKHLRMFQSIIDKVMAKDPAHRYQTGAELIKDLEKVSIADLDAVDRIMQQEIDAASKTDPHAATVLGDATPPPMLNTGNVTTADAARFANRIGAETQQPRKKNSPAIAVVVIALLLAGGAWILSQQHSGSKNTPTEISSVQNTPEPQTTTTEPQAAVPASPVTPVAVVSKPATSEQATKVQALENNTAAQETEKQKEEATAASQAEKKKQQEAAKALEQKKQQEALAAAQQKLQQEAAKADQARQQEIASRLGKADALREQGQLVSPEDNNAVTAYRAVLEIDPNNTKATQALKDVENSYLMGIRYQIEAGKMDEATNKLREANKVFPNNTEVGALLALEQQKAAEIAATKAAATQPKISKLVINDAAFESMELAQKSFIPVARTAYIGFSYQNFEGATSLLQAVLYDSAHAVKITQKPVVVTGSQGNVFFTLARPVEGFPDGGYNLELMLNDQKLISVVFTVKH